MRNLLPYLALVLLGTLGLGAQGMSAQSYQIETRLHRVLSTYLEASEFLIVVKELDINGAPLTNGEMGGLPGLPGLSSEESDVKYGGYFDLGGQLRGAKARPPVEVSILLHRTVSTETRSLLSRIVPSVAGIDSKYGDKIEIRTGNIESPTRKRWEDTAKEESENWIQTFVKYRTELGALFFGLIAAIGLIILANGILSIIREKNKGKNVPAAAPAASAPAPLPKSMSAAEQEANEAESSKASDKADEGRPSKRRLDNVLSRDELYSKDSAFFQMVEEIRVQAEKHPDRISQLIKNWIQEGEMGIRNAALLLRNFTFPIVEGVMSNMVASDLENLRSYMDIEFDFFSDINERVILRARQELMKIVASQANSFQSQSLGFLTNLESHVLAELLRDEPITSFVVASMGVPSNRMTDVLKALPFETQEQYFKELVGANRESLSQFDQVLAHLQKKLLSLKQILLTEDQRADSVLQMLKNIKEEKSKVRILNVISQQNAYIYQQVRSRLTLFEDVMGLPDRSLKTLILEEDPMVLAHAFSRSPQPTQQRISELLPKASQEIFEFEVQKSASVSEEQYLRACQVLVKQLEKLVYEQVISTQDLRHEAPAPTPGAQMKAVA